MVHSKVAPTPREAIWKEDLDREVADLLGREPADIAGITTLFLQGVVAALAEDKVVRLDGLGELHVRTAPPTLSRLRSRNGTPQLVEVTRRNVCFRKALPLTRALREGRGSPLKGKRQ